MRLPVTLPAAAAAGLAAGLAFFRGPQPPVPEAAAALGKKAATANAAAPPDAMAATDAKARRLLAAALRKDRGGGRDHALYLAIEALGAEDFHALLAGDGALKSLLEKLRGIDWSTGRDLVSALLGRWLKLDPGAVTAWAPGALDTLPRSEPFRRWLLDALAAKQPAEMLALVPSRKDAAERADIISRALRELAARDPARARAWLAGCTDAADRRVAEKAFVFGSAQADPLRAIELAGAMESRQDGYAVLRIAAEKAAKMGPGILRQLATLPMKSWMIAPLVDELAERDPDLAVELARKSGADGNDASFALRTAFSALARRDPAASIAKLEGLKDTELAAAVAAIGETWAGREPVAALNWLAARPDAERNSGGRSDALLSTFSNWAESAPAAARAWADALPAGATRDAVQTQLARSLAQRGEPAEATQILARLGRAADPAAMENIAGAWAQRDPQAAAAWAIAQEPGPAQSRALASIVGAWANDDRPAVEAWLAQFPPGEARDRSIRAFLWRGTAWTSTKEQRIAEFDAWFDRIDDPWERAVAARSSFWQRKERDPAAARAWLSTLPNVDPELIRATLRDHAD